MKVVLLISVALVFGYGNEYARLRSFGYWSSGHVKLIQLFLPSQAKLKTVDDENESRLDSQRFSWDFNRNGGIFIPLFLMYCINMLYMVITESFFVEYCYLILTGR